MDKTSACVYRLLEDGIHEHIFMEASCSAVDVFFANAINVLMKDPNDSAPALIDMSVGLPPVNYMLIGARDLARQLPERPNVPIALIVENHSLLQVLAIFMRSITVLRIYKPSERDRALDWLRASMETSSKR
jgi:hypothetical protein